LIGIADSNDTIFFFVLPEIRLRALITAPLVVIEEFFKDSNLNTDFFLSHSDTKAEFGSFLWNEPNERASHFCAYQKRSGLPVARLPNTIRTRMMVSRSGIALRTGILLIITRKKNY
jgi:hypothetical protein